ncbi:MAG TPA: AraC family transcriptional regulator [Allosphingosinicella sp.]|jgi:AraC-like DNA-binding protein
MTGTRKNMTGERASGLLSSGATVAAGLARGLIEFAETRGADRDDIVAAAGLDERALAEQDGRVPIEEYRLLFRAATAATGDPAFALYFGLQIDMAELSAVGLLLQSSATIAEVLVQLNRYTPLLVETECTGAERFEQQSRGGEIWIVDTRVAPNAFPELTETTFARFVGSTRQFGMRSFVTQVQVTHPEPDHAVHYARVFGIPTQFSAPWNAMKVDETWLAQPVRLQPAYLSNILTAHTEGLLRALEETHSIREQVERLLMPMLHSGEARMERAAGALGWSSDTLYRRLRAEGVTFEELLDDLRRKVALRYIEEEAVAISQIAYLVGFSEPSAFSRAFKRWTGRSPRSFRPAAAAVPPRSLGPDSASAA